ncbi:tyrosine-type recombinase/integrase [Pseudoalteromonas sp. US3C1013]|uniref:tyrosine-type recombinase/integrase n=1 Tax=unclassified Pseudoalteromonas TaxID=194690 RepID=UPI003AB6520D
MTYSSNISHSGRVVISCSELIKCYKLPTDVVSPISNRDIYITLLGSHSPVIYSIVDSQGVIVKCVQNWLRYLTKSIGVTITDGSVDQYGRSVVYFVRWIEEEKYYPNLSVDEVLVIITRQDIRAWVEYMTQLNLSPSTIRTREVCVKQLLDWLTTIDGGNVRLQENSPYGRDHNNKLKYVSKSVRSKSPKFIDTSTIISVLSKFYNECERCMFHTQYDTGLRISEIIELRKRDLPDLDLYPTTAEFIPMVVQGMKGRGGQPKERITLISRAVLNRIKRYHNTIDYKLSADWDMIDPDKPVFLTVNRYSWGYRNAKKQFDSAVSRSIAPEGFTTHWLRHGTAFSVLRSSIGRGYEDRILTVQQMLGHAHLSTTEVYTQISPALLADLTKKGHEIDRADEAHNIRKATFLPPLKHKERRGHK